MIAPGTDGVTVLGKGTMVESAALASKQPNSYNIKFIFGRFSPGAQLRIDKEMIQGSTQERIILCKVQSPSSAPFIKDLY